MKDFIAEFKAFAMRGNVVDLAIAVIVGAAFGKIVSSLVDNVVMPIIGIFLGGINLSELAFSFGETTLTYGVFLQSVSDFVIIAFVIFLAVRALARFKKKESVVEDKPDEPSGEIKLLSEIRDILRNR